jgi:hypothetical protein
MHAALPRAGSLLALFLAAAGCAGGDLAPLVLEDAREQQPPAAEEPRFLTDLRALCDTVEPLAPWKEARGAPREWGSADGDRLARELAPLEPFFRDLPELMARPECQAALAERKIVARTVPQLALVRNVTNLLCARALLDVRAGNERDALQRLSQATAVARLMNDGSEIGDLIAKASRLIVADGLLALSAQAQLR